MLEKLPEPSGPVSWLNLNNSYGVRGVYKVGTTEVANPDADIEWALQFLADAKAAKDFEIQRRTESSVAASARAAFLDDLAESADSWDSLSEGCQEAWRRVVRAVHDAG